MEEKIEKLILLNEELKRILNKKLEDGVQHKNNIEFFMSYIIGRAFKTHEATLLLCKNKYGEDAFMLARTLFELVINSMYIKQDVSEERLVRYFEYDWVTRKEMLDYVETKDALLKTIGKDQNKILEIKKEYSRVMGKYKYKLTRGWSDKSIYEMARSIGREDMYKTVYKLQCTMSHMSARSINEYVSEDPITKGVVINIGPNYDLTEKTLVIVFDLLDMVIKESNKLFDWKIDSEIEIVSKKFTELLIK